MFFRMPRVLRRFFREKMHPMASDKAMDVKSKISILYAVIAWNAGGFVIYQLYKGNVHWPEKYGAEKEDLRPAVQWARTLGIENSKVIKVSGFTISEPETIHVVIDKKKKGDNKEPPQPQPVPAKEGIALESS